MSRAERAKEYFLQGYACSQAVALALAARQKRERRNITKNALAPNSLLARQVFWKSI